MVIILASIVESTHTTTVSSICMMPSMILPRSNSSIVSSENVENDVKPPSIPVVSSRYTCGESMKFSRNSMENMPIRKEPSALTKTSERGKLSNLIASDTR